MIGDKTIHNWRDIVLANLGNIAEAKSTQNIFVTIEHVLEIGTGGKESIRFRVSWQGGPCGCVRTEADMDSEARGIAASIPVQCWFGKPDKVQRVEGMAHTYEGIVYIK